MLKVSKYAIALRLEKIGVAPSNYYQKKEQEWKPIERPRKPGGTPTSMAQQNIRRLGSKYNGLIMKALDRGAIHQVEAQELLGLKPKHFSELKDRIQEQRLTYGERRPVE